MDKRIRDIQTKIRVAQEMQKLLLPNYRKNLLEYIFSEDKKTYDKDEAYHALSYAPFMDIAEKVTPLSVFSLSLDFAYMLHKTDLECPENQLVYPFPSFFVFLPEIPQTITDSPKKKISWVSLYFLEHPDLPCNPYLSTEFWSGDDSVNLFSTPLETFTENDLLKSFDASLCRKSGTFFGEPVLDIRRPILSLIFKMLYYLRLENAPAPVLRKNKRKKKRGKKFGVPRPHKDYNIWDVGTEIKLTHKDGTPAPSTGSGPSWSLRNQTITRGHMRYQWYGPKDNQKRKLIWIKPYIRGAHLPPPAVGHVYKL